MNFRKGQAYDMPSGILTMTKTALLTMSEDEKKDDFDIDNTQTQYNQISKSTRANPCPLGDASNSHVVNKPSPPMQFSNRNVDTYYAKRVVDDDADIDSRNNNHSLKKNTLMRSKSRHFSTDVLSNEFLSSSISSTSPIENGNIQEPTLSSPRSTFQNNNTTATTTNISNNQSNTKQRFGACVREATNNSPDVSSFDATLRKVMEPHIAKGRRVREERRQKLFQQIGSDHVNSTLPIASNIAVPYPSLRKERSFLYDETTYPLDKLLCSLLGISDLSLTHTHEEQDKKRLMSPLLNRKARQPFHKCYDNFVTSFCIPLLHSLAMMENVFTDNNSSTRNKNNPDGRQSISYRYQAFPCIRIMKPGEFSIGPHCDMAYGHSIGNINFHIPLTPTYGTNALYTESRPGREDWHPLSLKSVGMGFVFDGARCLHYSLENTTVHTRVSLDFRIAISRKQLSIPRNYLMNKNAFPKNMMEQAEGKTPDEQVCDLDTTLCSKQVLRDNFSIFPGYYDEAFLDLGNATKSPGNSFSIPGSVVYKNSKILMDPDKRVGFPF